MIELASEMAEYVDAFENAHQRGEPTPLESFLPPPGHPLRQAVLLELVRIDLEHGWLSGQPLPLDAYRQRFPELFSDSKAVREILFEEYRLRSEVSRHGSTTGDVPRLGPAPLVAGSTFAGFRLLAQLGKGSFGQVFLAEQPGLAGRPVVLKIGTDLFHESQALAQLQHTHIVPIYSAHRQQDSQALCMPFLGVLTLGDMIEAHQDLGPPDNTGAFLRLAEKLRRQRDQYLPALSRATCPDNHPLHNANHIQAVLWIGECLADGLAHAHQRGLLHRDVKPANVLLTDDLIPMLLDFNLALDASQTGFTLGGTLMYMSPEQLGGFLGQPRALDSRSDIYALGLVLYELLTGSPPWPAILGQAHEVAERLFAQRSSEPPCLGNHLGISSGVRAILHRCLHPDPDCRYPSAAALRDDLARQRLDRGLVHVQESLPERIGKCIRRHPRLLPIGAAASLALLALVLLGQVVAHSRQVARHTARETLTRLVEAIPQAELATRMAGPGNPNLLAEAEQQCLNAEKIGSEKGLANNLHLLSTCEREDYHRRLADLLLCRARLRYLAGDPTQALELNEAAEQSFGPRRDALMQRAQILRHLGRTDQAIRVEHHAQQLPGPSAAERSLKAAQFRSRGLWQLALSEVEAALRDDPGDFRLWFDLGLCRQQLADTTGTLAALDTCLALAPRASLARFLRGSSHLSRGAHALALADLDPVVRELPAMAEARLNRAIALTGLNRLPEAEAELDRLITDGTRVTRTFFLRAEIRKRLGNLKGAEEDRNEGIRREPSDALSWVARALARRQTAPRSALNDIERALTLDPHLPVALQNRAYLLAEKLDRPNEAAATLARLLALRPGDQNARASRAVCLARAGHRREALDEVRRCLTGNAGAGVIYRIGCVYALTMRQAPRDRGDAMFYLVRAVQMGISRDTLKADADLIALRDDRDFQNLLTPPRTGGAVP